MEDNANCNSDERFYYNEKVDVINPDTGTVQDAQIVSSRGQVFRVKYTNSNQEQNIDLDEKLILKQCKFNINKLGKPGRNFKRFNRLDIRNTITNRFYEGIVLKVDKDRILVRYSIDDKAIEEWIMKDSNNIAPVGKYTSKLYTKFNNSDEINDYLHKKKKIIKINEYQEKKYRNDLLQVNLRIKDITGDGNCLFRAISDQIYGNEDYYSIIKSKCFDYMELEKDFFCQFIEGGLEKFDEYIELKRMEGNINIFN
jgi:hypothetical protein